MRYPLSKLVKIMYGKNQKDVVDENGKYPIYGTGGLMAYSNKYLYDKPSVLIGRKGTINKVKYVDSPFWTVDTLFYTIVNEKYVVPKYLYYKMLTIDLDYYNEGTTIPSLRTETLYRIELDIPSFAVQNKCIKILEKLDYKIKLNNEINNNLHELIKSMYDNLISDVDWNEVELSQVANVSSGKRPTTKNKSDEYPIIGANGIMAYTNEYNMSSDLIITGRVGTLGVVKRYYKPIWASDNTLIVNTKYLNYIENYLNTIDYNSLNRGSTQPLLTQGDLNKQTLLFNEDGVLEFENKVIPIVNKIRFNEEQNEILSQLRNTLLPKLMNGEIDLDNIEI